MYRQKRKITGTVLEEGTSEIEIPEKIPEKSIPVKLPLPGTPVRPRYPDIEEITDPKVLRLHIGSNLINSVLKQGFKAILYWGGFYLLNEVALYVPLLLGMDSKEFFAGLPTETDHMQDFVLKVGGVIFGSFLVVGVLGSIRGLLGKNHPK